MEGGRRGHPFLRRLEWEVKDEAHESIESIKTQEKRERIGMFGEYTSEIIQSLRDNSVHSFNGSFIDIILLWFWRRCKLSCRCHNCRIDHLPRFPILFQLLSRQSSYQSIPLTPSTNFIPQSILRRIPSPHRSGRVVLSLLLFAHEIERIENVDEWEGDEIGDVLDEGREGETFGFYCEGIDAEEVCEVEGGSGEDGDRVGEDQVQEFTSDEDGEAMEKQNDGANGRHGRCSPQKFPRIPRDKGGGENI
jgi:hypothetical protein